MVQVTAATFAKGVLVPDDPLDVAPDARVRVTVQPFDEAMDDARRQAWEDLQKLWQNSAFDSMGDRLTREQLHERR